MAKDWRKLSFSPELLQALKLPPTQAEALRRIAATSPRPLSLYQRQELQKVRVELARVKRDQASLQEYARVLDDWLVRELGRPVSNPLAPVLGPDASVERPLSAPAVLSASEMETETSEPLRSSKEWVKYAIEQNHELLAGMSVRAACELLAQWMRKRRYNPRKPIGWSRIRTIATDQGLLPIKRPR
jgi:hypothetical protein